MNIYYKDRNGKEHVLSVAGMALDRVIVALAQVFFDKLQEIIDRLPQSSDKGSG